jgi:hypothetical protein
MNHNVGANTTPTDKVGGHQTLPQSSVHGALESLRLPELPPPAQNPLALDLGFPFHAYGVHGIVADIQQAENIHIARLALVGRTTGTVHSPTFQQSNFIICRRFPLQTPPAATYSSTFITFLSPTLLIVGVLPCPLHRTLHIPQGYLLFTRDDDPDSSFTQDDDYDSS